MRQSLWAGSQRCSNRTEWQGYCQQHSVSPCSGHCCIVNVLAGCQCSWCTGSFQEWKLLDLETTQVFCSPCGVKKTDLRKPKLRLIRIAPETEFLHLVIFLKILPSLVYYKTQLCWGFGDSERSLVCTGEYCVLFVLCCSVLAGIVFRPIVYRASPSLQWSVFSPWPETGDF